MRFLLRKLPLARAAELETFSPVAAEPYRPLPAPVYVQLPKNEKLVSVKGPFDFFNPRDLEKMRKGGKYFYGPIMKRVEPFRSAAVEVRKMLSWSKPSAGGSLEPAPFEISDAVLRKLAMLWAPIPSNDDGGDVPIGIETYFAVIFVNELCEPIPGDALEHARERDPDQYEIALLRSGVFVFLALHLGYLDLAMLNRYRERFFNELIQVTALGGRTVPMSMELSELKRWTESLVHSADVSLISSEQFQYSISRVTQKLKSRLARVRTSLCDPEAELAHTYDQDGLGLFRTDEEESDG